MTKFYAWYDNQSDPLGRPTWEAAGVVEASNAQDAALLAKQDGCLWTRVCVTRSVNDYPKDNGSNILAKA